jgi:hypothetical protein
MFGIFGKNDNQVSESDELRGSFVMFEVSPSNDKQLYSRNTPQLNERKMTYNRSLRRNFRVALKLKVKIGAILADLDPEYHRQNAKSFWKITGEVFNTTSVNLSKKDGRESCDKDALAQIFQTFLKTKFPS